MKLSNIRRVSAQTTRASLRRPTFCPSKIGASAVGTKANLHHISSGARLLSTAHSSPAMRSSAPATTLQTARSSSSLLSMARSSHINQGSNFSIRLNRFGSKKNNNNNNCQNYFNQINLRPTNNQLWRRIGANQTTASCFPRTTLHTSLTSPHSVRFASAAKQKLARAREQKKKKSQQDIKKNRKTLSGVDDTEGEGFAETEGEAFENSPTGKKKLPPPIPPPPPVKEWPLLYAVPAPVYPENEWIFTKNVPDFTEKSLNMVVPVNEKEKALFFPEGFAGFKEDEDALGKGNIGFLIREQTVDLVSKIRLAQENKFAVPTKGNSPYSLSYTLHGDSGVGKSAILNSLVYWARNNGWLCIFVPRWEDTGKQIRMTESERERGSFDQLKLATDFLTAQTIANREKLEKIPIKFQDWTLPGFDQKEGSTLLDLVNFGLKYPGSACDAVYYFRKELSEVTEFPVLIVTDNISLLWNRYAKLYDPYGKNPFYPQGLPYRKFSFARTFREYYYPNLKNGLQVSATTHALPVNSFVDFHKFENRPFINVPTYTKEEYEILNRFYDRVGFYAFTKIPQTQTRDYVYALNGGNGRQILKYSALAF